MGTFEKIITFLCLVVSLFTLLLWIGTEDIKWALWSIIAYQGCLKTNFN